MPQGKGTYGSKVGRPPKKKDSLLNSDRERYQFGGQAAKAMMKRINKWLGKTGQKKLNLEELIKEYEKLTPEQLEKKFNTIDPKTGEWDVTRIKKDKDFDMFMINEVGLTQTERDFVLTKYPDFQGETAADVYKHTQSEKFVDDMYLDARAERGIAEAEEAAYRDAGPDDLPFSKGGRVAKAKGGEMEDQMNALAISVAPARIEEQQLPDEEMEEDYVDYVIEQTLSAEDQNYLDSALAKDDRLSELFDEVVESAAEFSGSGPIEGPGTEVSDSIPARLSDGEFVFTAKAVDEIGADVLQQQMKAAEAKADERQVAYAGGVIDEEDQAAPIQTRGLLAAQGNIPNVAKQSRQVEEEMLKSSPRRYYVPVSG